MNSKMIQARHQRARNVVSSALRYADDMARKLDRGFALHGGHDSMPDWSTLQTFAGHRVDSIRVDLLAADRERSNTLRRSACLRHQRDESEARLRRLLLRIRDIFESTYGRGSWLRVLGLDLGLPRKPVAMHRYGERAMERMTDPALELPQPAMKAVRLDLARLVGSIQSDLEILGRSLEQLQDSQRQVRRAVANKRKVIRRFDREIGPWARLLEAVYELGDEEALAADMRPYTRRGGRPRKGKSKA